MQAIVSPTYSRLQSVASPTYSTDQQALNLNSLSLVSSASYAITGPPLPFQQYKNKKKQKNLFIEISNSGSSGGSTPSQTATLKCALKATQEQLRQQQLKNDELIYKISHLEQAREQHQFYDEKLREKESKIKEMQKLYEKVVSMNRELQRELSEGDRKIMELEREMQKMHCINQIENLNKIKEGKIKENLFKGKENGKSGERKKGSIVKKNKINCNSTINLMKKHIIK